MIIGGLKLARVEGKWPCSSAFRPQLTLFSTFGGCLELIITIPNSIRLTVLLFFKKTSICVSIVLAPQREAIIFTISAPAAASSSLRGALERSFSAVREKWCRIVLINLVKVENYAKLSKLEAKRTRKMSSKLNCESRKYCIWITMTRDMIHEEVQNRRQPVLSSENGRFNKKAA